VRVELFAVEADDLVASHLLGDVQRVVGAAYEVVGFPDLFVRP